MPFIIMRKKLGLVGRDIDADGTVALATFASQTQIKRFFYVLITPAVFNDITFGHLPEQVSAAAGGMFFFSRYPETGAHYAAVVVPALADANTTQCGSRKAAFILGKLEVRLRFPGMMVCAEAEIFVELVRLDELSRIHLPSRVPNRFEFPKRLHQLRPKHFWQQLCPLLPIAMLA